MSRRLEIELTSERPDGSWTWRAAGAKQPKGEMAGSLLPSGTKVGDVLRADAEFVVDGIDIVGVLAPKATRKQPELLEIVGSGRSEPGVTTQLVGKRDRDGAGGGRRDRRDGRDRKDGRDRAPRGDRSDRSSRGERPSRPPRTSPVPERPKPKRLRPGRANRTAVLEDVAPEMRPIAEQVMRGGVPAVREAAAEQNAKAKTENRPEVPVDQVVALAEAMLPALRTAEWTDRAQAALADLEELDLRDLRSVVVAADNVTRNEATRALKEQLQDGLNRRVEEEHVLWIADIKANLDAGRFVRALRLSSRPPKAGTPVPTELSTALVTSVSNGLTAGTNQELWAAAVDALAYSPVRLQVEPTAIPEKPSDELLEAVRRVADRLPALAARFGVDPADAAAAKRRSRSNRGSRPGGKGRDDARKGGPRSTPPKQAEPAAPKSGSDTAPAAVPDAPPADAVDAAPTEAAADTPAVDPAAAEAAADTAPAPVDDAIVTDTSPTEAPGAETGSAASAEAVSAEADGADAVSAEGTDADAGSADAASADADGADAERAPTLVDEAANGVQP